MENSLKEKILKINLSEKKLLSHKIRSYGLSKQILTKIKSSSIANKNFSNLSRNAEDMRRCCLVYYRVYKNSDLNSDYENCVTHRCKSRLCPTCSRIRVAKALGNFRKKIEELSDDYEFLFTTFTIKNCPADEESLKRANAQLLRGFRALTRKTNYPGKGYIRTLEVTYNKETNTFHPHLHVIFAVKKSYFTSDEYWSHRDWVSNWKSALKVDYFPSVNIKKIIDLESAHKETCKSLNYSMKTSKMVYDDTDIAVLADYLQALKNTRLFSTSGVLRFEATKTENYVHGIKFDVNFSDVMDQHLVVAWKFSVRDQKYQLLDILENGRKRPPDCKLLRAIVGDERVYHDDRQELDDLYQKVYYPEWVIGINSSGIRTRLKLRNINKL